MIRHSAELLLSLTHFPLSSLPPSLPASGSLSASISESSTRISDLSSVQTVPKRYPPFQSDLTHGTVGDQFPRSVAELLPQGPFSDHPGYIPILPRTSTASGLFEKRCETCNATHDGSFGAGRFCSSRCARTVGGLAHRKKRMLERGMKARTAAENRAKAKMAHVIARDVCDFSSARENFNFVTAKSNAESCTTGSPRSVMRIGALLNPCN